MRRPVSTMLAAPVLAWALLAGTAMVGGAETTADADGIERCPGPGRVVVVNGTNDTPPPDTDPAVARYLGKGYRPTTLVYPATVWPLGASTYDDNVRDAVPRLARIVDDHFRRCPDQPMALVGFSQGSRIIGDVVSAAGNNRSIDTPRGPLTPTVIADELTVELYADPRRDQIPGRAGAGIETVLGPGQLYPGLTLTGPRDGGFGDLRSRVVEVCMIGDPICDTVRPPGFDAAQPDPSWIPVFADGLLRFSTRHTRYGPDPGQPTTYDPWPHAVNGTWMVEPSPMP